MQGNYSIIATIAVGAIIIGAVAYGIYSTNSCFSAQSEQNTSLKGQIAGINLQISSVNQQIVSIEQQMSALSTLSEQNSNLESQVSGLSQQLVGLNQQLTTLEQQVSVLEQRTLTVVTVSNTVIYIQTTSVTSTSTVTSISIVPQSTLVIIADTFNSTAETFTFQVQNSQSYTVYAQLSASLWGYQSFGCFGQAGSYVSQVYTFAPNSVTTTKMDLTLGQWAGFCGQNPISSADVTFIIPQSTAVSPTYTFNIVPNYNHP
ncbi:MAG: hypothetical protein ABSB26_06320 [Nitrososphaerales archaeon]|jgi:hypothetical protein